MLDLEEIRSEIDQFNEEIVDVIDQRMNHVVKVTKYKSENDMDIVDKEREEEVMQKFAELFEERDMPPSRGRQLGRLLIDTAVDLEKEILSEDNE